MRKLQSSLFALFGVFICAVTIIPASAQSNTCDTNTYFVPNVQACENFTNISLCTANATVQGCACYADGSCEEGSAPDICTVCNSTSNNSNAALISFNVNESCPVTASNNVPLYVCNQVVMNYVQNLTASSTCGLGCICYSDGSCARDYVTLSTSCNITNVTLVTTGICPVAAAVADTQPVATRGPVGQSSIRHY